MKKNGQALFQLARSALEKAGAHSKMAERARRNGIGFADIGNEKLCST